MPKKYWQAKIWKFLAWSILNTTYSLFFKMYLIEKYTFTGKTAEEEIQSSFLEALGESCSNPSEVSYSEFEDYYEGLSFGIVGDDDFVNILRNSWGI